MKSAAEDAMTPAFRLQLKRQLAPLLRTSGFAGSGMTFRRVSGEAIHVLHIQGSRYGDSCCVNLGVHLTFLPTALGSVPDRKKMTEPRCEFRRRLAPPGQEDCWWHYGASDRDAARSVRDLVDLVRKVGLAHFHRFASFPESFSQITPMAIASGDFSQFPGWISKPRAALAMARISAHLGQPDMAREFAIVGLAFIGAASALERELSALASSEGSRES